MPVEVSLPLSPAMQAGADARENVKKLAEKVEDVKGKLKAVKSAWEEAVEELNGLIDTMIENERQPTLFDQFAAGGGAGEAASDPVDAGAGEESAEAGQPSDAGDAGDSEGRRVTVEATLLALPPSNGIPASTSTSTPEGWRKLHAADHFDAGPEVWEAFAAHGHTDLTLGELADLLLRGETFGLPLVMVDELRDHIEQASADDPVPVVFGEQFRQGNREADDRAAEAGYAEAKKKGKGKKAHAKKGA